MTNATETRAEHTPGPWEAVLANSDHRDPFAHQVNGAGDKQPVVARVNAMAPDGKNGWIGAGGDPAANARLIAAAPELLEAAEETVGTNVIRPDQANFADPSKWVAIPKEHLNLLRSAIAKARGESP